MEATSSISIPTSPSYFDLLSEEGDHTETPPPSALVRDPTRSEEGTLRNPASSKLRNKTSVDDNDFDQASPSANEAK